MSVPSFLPNSNNHHNILLTTLQRNRSNIIHAVHKNVMNALNQPNIQISIEESDVDNHIQTLVSSYFHNYDMLNEPDKLINIAIDTLSKSYISSYKYQLFLHSTSKLSSNQEYGNSRPIVNNMHVNNFHPEPIFRTSI